MTLSAQLKISMTIAFFAAVAIIVILWRLA